MAKYLPPLIAGKKWEGWLGFDEWSNRVEPEIVDNAVVPHYELFASKAAAKRGGYEDPRRVTIILDEGAGR